MQTSLHGRRKGSPPPRISDCNREEDICSEGDSEGEDNSYLPPEVFALTWHAGVGYIMHMVSCIAYFIHQICHLLSLDILFVNAICLVYSSFMWIMQRHLVLPGIIYVNFAMPSCLASHLICKLYQAILFLRYILHLSTMLVHSTALRVHQPFDTVMVNFGVKTRSSE